MPKARLFMLGEEQEPRRPGITTALAQTMSWPNPDVMLSILENPPPALLRQVRRRTRPRPGWATDTPRGRGVIPKSFHRNEDDLMQTVLAARKVEQEFTGPVDQRRKHVPFVPPVLPPGPPARLSTPEATEEETQRSEAPDVLESGAEMLERQRSRPRPRGGRLFPSTQPAVGRPRTGAAACPG